MVKYMPSIDETIDRISDNLYWKYKDIWDGYVSDEVALFTQIRDSDDADDIANMLHDLLKWKDSVPDSVFVKKTKRIAALADFQSRGISFAEWLMWAVIFIRNTEIDSA
jgi:hypothetical protein